MVGEDPAQGVFEEQKFMHPELELALDFPVGWKTENTAAVVGAISPGQDALVALRIAAKDSTLDATVAVNPFLGQTREGLATTAARLAGQRLQQAMENSDLFPNMVIQMIAVGEESGSLDEMSSKVADFFEEDVDNAVDNLSSLLEPLIMAILGVLVGGLVVAMYLPIFKMGAVI